MTRGLALPRELNAETEPAPEAPRWDEARFRAFYESIGLRLRRYLQRASGSLDLAQDILQESYLRFLRSGPSGSSEADARALLFKIATNLLYDHWRRAGRERRLLGWLTSAGPSRDADLRHDVNRLLETLKPRERALVWLAYVEGCTHAEIAGILGLRPMSVRVVLFRARARLAGVLARAGLGKEVLR